MRAAEGLDAISISIALWARCQPIVRRVWLFGSRVRDDFREDSDLDIAVELDVTAGEGIDGSAGIALWMFDTESWREELQILSPYKVQLEQYLQGQTPTIETALNRSSRLIYEKSAA